jgi:hypothetical protein
MDVLENDNDTLSLRAFVLPDGTDLLALTPRVVHLRPCLAPP